MVFHLPKIPAVFTLPSEKPEIPWLYLPCQKERQKALTPIRWFFNW
jgi:hypothetical protein